MTLVLTFLGKGGIGCTTIAIAAAKQLASLGSRVLLVSNDPSPAFGTILGLTPDVDPQAIGANLEVVQLQSTVLLERGWEQVKELEQEYLRSPTLKNVYGQELSILSGMDGALALKSIREYRKSGKYDVIIYDGAGDISTLRMLGVPESFSWYIRRFRQIFLDSELGKAISPFVQPVSAAILNTSWTFDNLTDNEPTKQANSLIEEAKAALADPQQIAAYLVTNDNPAAIASAKYLWGSAQQIGLTVGGVLLNQASAGDTIAQEFTPLTITSLPTINSGDWQPLMDALPNLRQVPSVPKPITIDVAKRQVSLFLPGFTKKQVKLTQYGPEITIEAGDQRRNVLLPPPLSGQPVKGAKFQDQYLIISF